ncbi:MAG TPA: hypothetical protein VLA91_16555 [Acidimicrobiia bacterium]|nr:hypothetical protein [Acidimicrobiia bacterium]
MKKTTIVIALAAMLGLAAIPALAQNEQPATESSPVCPFHDQEGMTYEDMDRRMDSAAHDEWMDSADHDRMHAAMGDMDRMMDEHGVQPGNMMGSQNMMGAGNMMGSSG